MMRKAKIALAFVLGAVYASAWWIHIDWEHGGIPYLFVLLFRIIGSLLIVCGIVIVFVDHWDEDK